MNEKTPTSEEVDTLIELIDTVSDQIDDLRALEVELTTTRNNARKRLRVLYDTAED